MAALAFEQAKREGGASEEAVQAMQRQVPA